MRHQKKHGMKLGTDASHTKAMKKSLVRALLTNDRIKTTLTRAKAIRPEIDKVVTWAKRGDLHARRLAIAAVGDAELVRETFDKAAQGMWQDRSGGYTRIMKLGTRKGDNAEIAIIELVQEAAPAKKTTKPAKPAAKVSKVVKKEESSSEKAKDDSSKPAPKQADAKEPAKDDKAAAQKPDGEEKPAAGEKNDDASPEKPKDDPSKPAPKQADAKEPAKDEKAAAGEPAKDDKAAAVEPVKDEKPAPADSAKEG